MNAKKSIFLIDDDPAVSDALRQALQGRYLLESVSFAENTQARIQQNRPDLIMIDLDAADGAGIELCKEFKESRETRNIPVILMIPREQKEALIIGLKAGAEDYTTKPIYPPELLARVDLHLRTKDYYSGLDCQDLKLLLELSETISATRNPMTILRQIVDKMSDVIDVARCSIVSVCGSDGLIVKASNDLPKDREIELQLKKYPEIGKALQTKQAVIVNDIKNDLLMEPVREDLEGLDFNSIIVIPILKKESVIGTFFLRTASPIPNAITERIYKLSHIVANISANALENAILFESMKTAQDYLEQMSIRDGLTKLYNHLHFFTRLKQEFSRAQRHCLPLSCVFFDVDDFKNVNDRYGHLTGDEVLREIGQLILSVVRETDLPARYGGDEFAIILPNTTAGGAFELANRLSQTIGQHDFGRTVNLGVSVSIGIATFWSCNYTSYQELLQSADQAMYSAKARGKGQVAQF